MPICFEIFVNGRPVSVAGAENVERLSAIVDYDPKPVDHVDFDVHGICTRNNQQELWKWLRTQLRVGDEVLIRVIASDQPSEPAERISKDALFGRE